MPDQASVTFINGLLRTMQQARYSEHNHGHYGLAAEFYTHFTSPIRRYPDLLVHRVIKAILSKTRYRLPALPVPGEAHAKLARRLASKVQEPERKLLKTSTEMQGWEAAGLHCSANERRADEASRDVEAWLKCKYMREHLGEEFSGVVSAATSFGIFVTLDAMYVEGLVHITELGGEYFKFDESRQELRGERTGIRYAIGSRVQVQVSRVDLDGRKIDFRLVPQDGGLPVRVKREATRGKAQDTMAVAELSAETRKAVRRRSDEAAGEVSRSPIQALKASVRNATERKKGKSGKAPRKTRR